MEPMPGNDLFFGIPNDPITFGKIFGLGSQHQPNVEMVCSYVQIVWSNTCHVL